MTQDSKIYVYTPEKIYEDRAAVHAATFPETAVLALTPETATLMLSSKENQVLLRSLYSLNKFCELQQGNADVLRDLNTIATIVKNELWNQEDIMIRRFAFKLLAEIYDFSDVKFETECFEEVFQICRNEYLVSNDNFLVEYASVIILATLSEPRICSKIEDDVFFITGVLQVIQHATDPDILFNSYNIIIQIFKFLPIYKSCKISGFPFERILSDVCHELVEVQRSAIETLKTTVYCSDEFYESRYACPDFFDQVFTVLENDEWRENHQTALDLMRRLMRNDYMAKMFTRSDFLAKLYMYMKSEDSFKLEAVGVVAELENHEEILENLHFLGFTDLLINLLKMNEGVGADMLIAFERLLKYPDAFKKIKKEDIIPTLVAILPDETKYDLKTRQAAAVTMQALINRTATAADSAVYCKVGEVIANYLKMEFGQLPQEFLLCNLNVLMAIAKYPQFRPEVMTTQLATCLLFALEVSIIVTTIH